MAGGLPTADVGIFGGSGFYGFLEEASDLEVTEVTIQTPYGAPSAPVAVAEVDGCRVAFMARHGRQHEHPAHRVNYRANLWAFRRLGVRQVLGPCSVGSLRPDIHPGDFVLCDQLVDRTKGRDETFFDGPVLNCTAFADPYCPDMAPVLVQAAEELGITVHQGGTVVVIQGPRFSTRAESRWFSTMGWDVVNMTQYPEAVLARELGLCYAGIALVTDYDVGLEGAEGIEAVTMDRVLAVLAENIGRVQGMLRKVLPALAGGPDGCGCGPAPVDPGS